MPAPRSLLVSLLCSALALSACTGGGDTPPERDRTRSVTLEVLPGIAQPGPDPERSLDAPVLVSRVRPRTTDAVALLQRREGSRWVTVARRPLDERGEAVFGPDDTPAAGARGELRAVVRKGGQTIVSEVVETGQWSPIFRDEFDGTTFDGTKWDYRIPGEYNPEGSRQCSMSDESAVAVSGGTVQLQVRRDPDRLGERCRTPEDGTHDYYVNGHISTDGIWGFTYGVAAARVKFQQGRGQHGAFWLQRGGFEQTPGDPGSSGAEIDVAEYFGEGYPKGGLASFVFYLNQDNENEKVGGLWPRATEMLPAGDDWWRSYHVFSVEWTPEEYVFRVDGREIFRTDEGVSGVEQFLVLSLLTSDWELGKLDTSSLPSTMEVDWVRVWQPAAS